VDFLFSYLVSRILIVARRTATIGIKLCLGEAGDGGGWTVNWDDEGATTDRPPSDSY
jgi:hypothetical protein